MTNIWVNAVIVFTFLMFLKHKNHLKQKQQWIVWLITCINKLELRINTLFIKVVYYLTMTSLKCINTGATIKK